MILRLTCPGCRKDSYTASVEVFKPCPFCGIVFSGKHGYEKRKGYRIRKEIPFLFSHNGQFLEANTVDISDSGFSIRIFGQPVLPIGDIMNLSVQSSSIKAEVMWVYNDPVTSTAMTGLKIIDGRLNL